MMRHDPFWVFSAALIGAGSALAQVPDPTRPPDAVTTSEAAVGTVAPAASGVQTVILRTAGKSAAVINGQYVEVGGKLGDKRVLEISESEVVLKGESGREIIKMTPAIEKMPIKMTPAIKRRETRTTEK